MKNLNWFLAKLVFQISIEGKSSPLQFEEQFRLIKADELDWAAEKAGIIGKMEETNFLNSRNQKVSWQFVETVEVLPLEELTDGMELYSRTKEPENVNAYINLIKSRARQLSDKLKAKNPRISMDHTVTALSLT